MAKKILLSGVKPTGRPHIGNYFGAMKQFVDLLNTGNYECYFMIADYHALNLIQNANEMRENIINLAIDYLAIGLDPKKAVIFKQSDVSAHTELCWIFDSITSISYLARAHAFKAAVEKYNDSMPAQRSLASKLEQLTQVNVGTFTYPVLMAADILLYNADIVPVGADQKQHVEYARDIAAKFNQVFCPQEVKESYLSGLDHTINRYPEPEVFKLPQELIVESVKTVPGIDGRKMSKSYGNTIQLFATDEEIYKAVMSIVTDSGSGVPVNVRAIHELVRPKEYLDELYAMHQGKYKILKEALAKDLQDFIRPMRERREKLAKDRKNIIKILEKGAKEARKVADTKLKTIKGKIGVI